MHTHTHTHTYSLWKGGKEEELSVWLYRAAHLAKDAEVEEVHGEMAPIGMTERMCDPLQTQAQHGTAKHSTALIAANAVAGDIIKPWSVLCVF